MPVVMIEIGKKYDTEKEMALMRAVFSALQKAFTISNNDIHVRLVAYEPHRFFVPITSPSLYAHPELFTLVTIDCIKGRSLDAKRNLYRFIVENLEVLGVPKDHVKILLRESPKENWGIRGGVAGCDVQLEYAVEV